MLRIAHNKKGGPRPASLSSRGQRWRSVRTSASRPSTGTAPRPDIQTESLPGGHLTIHEQPEALAALISEFERTVRR